MKGKEVIRIKLDENIEMWKKGLKKDNNVITYTVKRSKEKKIDWNLVYVKEIGRLG